MGEIRLEDKDHIDRLRDELVSMWRKKEMLDYSIRGHYRTFRIHSVILAAMSPKFREMLISDMGEAVERKITFPNIPDGVMAAIIDFAYTGKCTMHSEKLLSELFDAAMYLEMRWLLKCIIKCMQQTNKKQVTTITDPSHAFSLQKELYGMYVNDELLHCSIIFNDHETEFPCHPVVLAAMSPMLKDVLSLVMKQKTTKGATLPTIPYELMKELIPYELMEELIPYELMEELIGFAYSGICTILAEQLPKMIEAAIVLQMSHLKEICQHHASLLTATITVTDQFHPSHLCEELVSMWKDEELCDYSIRGQYRTFRIHSVVLAAMSPTFKGILRSDRQEVVNTEPTFPNISDNHIAQLIEFSYTGECTLKCEQLEELTDAAHYLKMSRLLKLCLQNSSATKGNITLKDTSHPSHIFEGLVTMWKETQLLDYHITGKDRTFRVFSILLCAASPVFKGMLSSGMQEATKKEASFPTIPDEMLSAVIEFVHMGWCTIQCDQLMGLIETAHFMEIDKLLQACQKQVEAVLSPINCLAWCCFASKYDLTILTAKLEHFKMTSFDRITATASFRELTKSDLIQYLQEAREYGVDWCALLSGMIIWLDHDWPKRSLYLQSVLLCCPNIPADIELLLERLRGFKCKGDVLHALNTMQNKEDQTILVCGGYSDTDVNTKCWELLGGKFEIIHDHQDQEQKITSVARYHSLCEVPHGIMMTGGEQLDMCLMYSLEEKKWTKRPEMIVARSHHGSGYNKGKVFVIAGYVEGSQSLSVDFLDMVNNVWRNGPDVPGVCSVPQVVSIIGNLYVLFTETCDWYRLHENEDMSEVDKISIRPKEKHHCSSASSEDQGGEMGWTKLSPLPKDSSGCSLAASADKIFAAGGRNNIAYMYEIFEDLWCPLTGPSITEIQGSLVYHSEKLYLFPGFTMMDPELVDVKEYDFRMGSWSLSKWKMPKPLRLFGAFAFDKRIENKGVEEEEDEEEEDEEKHEVEEEEEEKAMVVE